MRVALLLITCLAVISAAAEPLASRGMLVDRSIRYVNEDVITLGDVIERVQARRGPAPTSIDETVAIYREALDELTGDALLVQFAEEKQVQIDRADISLMVLDQARAGNRQLSLDEQGRARRRLERREKMNAALSFFDGRVPQVSPAQALVSYQERLVEFRRPARARILQIAFRASDPAEGEAIAAAATDLFRMAQEVPDEAIAALVAPRLEALLAATGDDRSRMLGEFTKELADLAADATTSVKGKRLREDAIALRARLATLRSPEQAETALNALREELAGKDVEAFKERARALSQGPRVQDGGDLGWIEPGYFTPALDAAVFATQSGALTPVFWSQGLVCLVFVQERQEAAQRSFSEVSGEVEAKLRKQRQDQVRKRAIEILRSRAMIHDLADLPSLIRS
ncbi:MAG: peptidylprolyl isomerase [Planctomycetes bacterium]|nr:peptidylprolyl isomerase [Planctomycetota bacterium]